MRLDNNQLRCGHGEVFGESLCTGCNPHATQQHLRPIKRQKGTNITISPTNGLGAVTINSSGGGGGTSGVYIFKLM